MSEEANNKLETINSDHEVNNSSQNDKCIGPQINAVKLKKPGFMAGVNWGVAGIRWAVRRPFFFLTGLGMLVATMGLAWLAPWGGVVAGIAIISGIACSGSAARGLALSEPGSTSPWRSWGEPWHRKNRGLHVCRIVISGVFLLVINNVLKVFTTFIMTPLDPMIGMTSATARWGSLVLCYALLVWLLASAGPVHGAAKGWIRLMRVIRAPMALMGFACFWLFFLILTVVTFSICMVWANQSATGGSQQFLQAAVFFAALMVIAPLVSMSAGLSSLDLDQRDFKAEQQASEEAKLKA